VFAGLRVRGNRILRTLTSASEALPQQFSQENREIRRSLTEVFGSMWLVRLYGEQAGIPVEGPSFIARLRGQLEAAARRADDTFPGNEYLRIENGEPVLKRLPRKPEPEGLLRLEQQLAERISVTLQRTNGS
jgi:hypothetical protein